MIVAHVAIEPSEDYVTRREPHRRAHVERLVALRAGGVLVAGGPAPDGRSVDLFYRLERPDQLAPLVEEDPYSLAKAWVGYTSRSFSTFVEPWEVPPVVLDGSRRATIVEGAAADADMAQFALIELRGTGRLVFGGLLDGGKTLAVVRSPEPPEAARWLGETGFWTTEGLLARPWLYVL